jgi:L-ascorbate metabolism protein UlaG (beta-lactamase superfamily)
MKLMTRKQMALVFMLLLFTLTPISIYSNEQTSGPIVRIHYLGHASFLLQFDNGISVLTDYGVSKAYGNNSPVYDLTGREPTIVTLSHDDPDHNRNAGFKNSRIITLDKGYKKKGLSITPIRTSENSINLEDNTSYLFNYKGHTILHLADAQAYITDIDKEDVKTKIKELYPDKYDVLLMTIEGRTQFIPQAEKFIEILKPSRVIPMHYWSPAYKNSFLEFLAAQNTQTEEKYKIVNENRSDYNFTPDSVANQIQIISLDPSAMKLD